jgi:pimeloyl-ACP methyl ester carboxylesterase
MTSAYLAGQIETLNGIETYFEVHGTGDPVVLLHGFSGSSQDWLASLAELRRHFELIVPDLHGRGRSSMLSRPFRHQDAAADMLALLDHLRIDSRKGLGVSGASEVVPARKSTESR